MHPRIERSGFKPGEYVGYAGGAWRIRKTLYGGWKWAAHQPGSDPITGETIYADTLYQLGRQLDRWEEKRSAQA